MRIVGVSLAALLILAAMAFSWLVYSESGARSALALARRWLPAGISVEEVRGTVAGTLRIRHFRYRDEAVGLDLFIEDASLQTAALTLLSRRLHVERAEVNGVRVELFAPTAPASRKSTRDPWLAPLDMQVDELRVVRGELRRAPAAPFVVNRLHVAASWIGSEIQARAVELEAPQGRLSVSARLAPPAPRLQQLEADFRWHSGGHDWTGNLRARGQNQALQIDAALSAPVNLKLAGTLAGLRTADRAMAWRAHLSVPRFDPHPLIDTDAFETLALELDADGNLDALALRGTVSVDQERLTIEKLDLARQQNLLEIATLKLRLNSQPAAITGRARLSLDGSQPSSGELSWDEFALPEAWAGARFRCSGKLALTQAQDRFALNGMARLARRDRYSTLTLRADGSKQRVRIQELELTQMPGELSVTGDVQLDAPVRWALDARARAFDPSSFFEAWPGALDFDLRTQGHWTEAGPRARFELAQLDGRLRARRISGSGDLALGPDLKPSGRLDLKSGGTTLEVVAASDAARVDARLQVPALTEWRNDLRGSLDLTATSIGRWPRIELDANITAGQLRHGNMAVESATLALRGQDARVPRGSAELRAQGVALSGFDFQEATITLEGDARAHTLAIDADGEPVSLELRANGSLSGNSAAKRRWTATLAALALDVERMPPLKLAEPAQLVLARDVLDLSTTCLRGAEIAVCAAGRRDAGGFAANYSVRALPLAVLVAMIAPQAAVTVEGTLEGSGNLSRRRDGSLDGQGSLSSAAGSIAQRGEEKELLIEYRDFGLDLDLTGAAARARLRGVLPRQGELGGEVTLAVAQADPALGGRAALKLRDLAPLAIWVPQLANLKGSAELAADFGGTLRSPRIGVTVRADGLDVEVPMLGVHLREGNFNATLDPAGRFQAEGAIRSGEGTVRATGARTSQGGLELELSGGNFLAANIPGARVIVAPDLSLSGKTGALALTGSVKIEDADVNLEKLSIARSYRTSPDVVIVDREVQVRTTGPGLTTDVRVILGERVKLAGFGLESTVHGELRVVEADGQPSRATGEIRVVGTYEAFGRKLSIERGRLQFAGTALDDPQLDILAERKLQDVTAKLRVSGTARNPKLDVFTDPAMSQADAMSYLLTGKAASETHGEEGAMVTSAAQSVGSVLGNRLAKRLGGKMGFVDEIGVEQNAELGGNAFTVGKYLSPKFFISYGVGLFEPGSTMTVRYEFSRHWSLEASQAPEDGHAGIRYRIEK